MKAAKKIGGIRLAVIRLFSDRARHE
jgi:hypothetical protein